MHKQSHVISWVLQIFVAGVLLWTLPYKLGGASESVALFSELGMEPHGRYIVGCIELLVCLLILIPGGIVRGAFLGAGVMMGAIIAHVTRLGFSGDAGVLGWFAVVIFLGCVAILYLRRKEFSIIGRMFGDDGKR